MASIRFDSMLVDRSEGTAVTWRTDDIDSLEKE